jgi:hypothetical protein
MDSYFVTQWGKLMSMPTWIGRGCCVLVAAWSWSASAYGHALEAIVRVGPDSIRIEVGYDDDTPAEQAQVVIRTAEGQVVYTGTTDERGQCVLPLLPAGRYTLETTAIGHRATVVFEVTTQSNAYESWRPNRNIGVFLGAAGLLAVTFIFWWRQRRSRQTPPHITSAD